MDIIDFKANYYFFKNTDDCQIGDEKIEDYGRIFVFVDFGNVRPWAKDFWPEENKFRLCKEIDITKLSEVCDWVKPAKKFFYYGYYPKMSNLPYNHELNIKHRNSVFRIDKAKRAGFLVDPKEIKMIPHYDEDGKYLGKRPKCNFDVEIAMDMILKIPKYDTVMLFSGDSDFGKLLSYLKDKGKKIIVVCTRNRMSTELEKVAKFIPAEILKVFLEYIKKNTPTR